MKNFRFVAIAQVTISSAAALAASLPHVGASGLTVGAIAWAGSHPTSERFDFSQLIAQQDDDFDFAGEGRSGRRLGGATRSDCFDDVDMLPMEVPLTALMPASNTGDTIAPNPTLWIYVPYMAEQVPVGEFVLQKRDRTDLYRAEFNLSATPGLVSVTLPESTLEANQAYRWYFNLYCDADKSSSPVFVQGWVQQIDPVPQLEAQLSSQLEDSYWTYAKNQIWWDAIAVLAERRMAEPTNDELMADWQTLLDAEGVELTLPDSLNFLGALSLSDITPDLEPIAN